MVFFLKASVFALMMAGSSLARPQSGFASQLAEEEPFNPNPVYAYAYQVADEDEQTYIAHEENRDGEDVTGEYSYVDPNGDLVTVTYQAGVMGYTEERSVQPGFVQIRARPASAPAAAVATTNSFSSNRGSSSSSSTSSNSGRAVVRVAPQVQQQSVTTTSSSAQSDGDLVARILAQLTPFIQQTVSSSLTGRAANSGSSTTTTTRRVSSAPAVRVIPAAPIPVASTSSTRSSSQSSAVQGIFGNGGPNNVRFNTPEFNYEFDLS